MKTGDGITSYQAIQCIIDFDDDKQDPDQWPQVLCCRPEIGDMVIGAGGRRGVIESVSHSFLLGSYQDAPEQEFQMPVIRISVKVTYSGGD